MTDNTLVELFLFLRHNYLHEILRSVFLIVALVIVRILVAHFLAINHRLPLDAKRRWSINTRNLLFATGVLGIGLIWANELQNLAVSMLAFMVALVLATKELIMCLSGGLLRQSTNSYGLGDHIEVGNVRGRVVDIGLLSTTVLEIGPGHFAHQITGRAITFPNSILLATSVIRENYMGEYVMHIINVPVPYCVAPCLAERVLMEAAKKVCQVYIEPARDFMKEMTQRYMIDAPSIEPRISIQPKDDKGYQLVLRVAIPALQRQRIEQAILHQFMWKCFPENNPNAAPKSAQTTYDN